MRLSNVGNVIMQHSNALLYMSCATPLAASRVLFIVICCIYTYLFTHAARVPPPLKVFLYFLLFHVDFMHYSFVRHFLCQGLNESWVLKDSTNSSKDLVVVGSVKSIIVGF